MTTSDRLCACECGGNTNLNARGEPNQYIRGHNRRGNGLGWKEDGYWYVSIHGRKIALHRWVTEQMLGRTLSADEVVHHVDGDPLNNDPDNLVVLTRAEHARLHRIGNTGRRATKEERDRVIVLHESGMTNQQVANATGRSPRSVRRWIYKAG